MSKSRNLSLIAQEIQFKIEASINLKLDQEIQNAIASNAFLISSRTLFQDLTTQFIIDSSIKGSENFYRLLAIDILKTVDNHENTHSIIINKEVLYQIIALTSAFMGDMLNFQIYLDLFFEERKRFANSQSFYDLFINDDFFKTLRFNVDGALNSNAYILQLNFKLTSSVNIFTTASTLNDVNLKLYLKVILDYRVLLPLFDRNILSQDLYNYSNSNIKEICILFESILKEKNQLIGQLLSQITSTQIRSSLLARITNLRNTYPIHSITDFNTQYPTLKAILVAERNEDEIIALSFWILYGLRNQVLHNNTQLLLFNNNRLETIDLIGILLSCLSFISRT